jgi:hypothetical protein
MENKVKKVKIEKMMNKNTCYDLFKEIVINDKPLYDQKSLE